jgi:sulfur-oxidizing protein SoxY
MKRRQLLQGALVLIACRAVRAAEAALPAIPAMTSWLAGRTPRFARIKLDLPSIADNGFSVPMKITVAGPFAPGPYVKSIRLFSEANPVPDMAVFDFAQPVERVEIESRVRLAGTQQVVAVAEMTDGTLLASVHEVIVTLAGCMDGT